MRRLIRTMRPSRQAPAKPAARLSVPELERALRQCDPAVRLVLPRILRRVIREHCRTGGWGWKVPHRKNCVIDRRSLLQIVDPIELGPDPPENLPDRVILLPLPAAESLAERPAGEVLLQYWRLLMHAEVHRSLDRRIEEGKLTAADVRRRIERIGVTAFEEIRAVLHQEHFLLPPRDDRTVYVEFAAVYTEMRYFTASFLSRYFPAIDGVAAIDAVLAEDLDAEALFRSSRPAGAPDPVDVPEPEVLDDWTDVPAPPEDPQGPPEAGAEVGRDPSARQYHRLAERAERAAAVGNVVRSAIIRARAERVAPRKLLGRARAAVKADVDRLARRLQAALALAEEGPQPWQESLAVLVRRSPDGVWTAEARLLYDLQSVCIDCERETQTVDLVEWMLSWGKRPIKRPLPSQRDILTSKHLRTAARRLAAVRLSDYQRLHLSALIRSGIEHAEQRIRRRLRPQIAVALDAVGLVPQNLPEQVARHKVIEEMLDRIVEHGFLSMQDFRDALSRNNLKLPDFSLGGNMPGRAPEVPAPPRGKLRGACRWLWRCVAFPLVWLGSRLAAFFRGDELLRADRILAVSLEGVYRRGETYLRWMQRLSSLAFGTRPGRFLTRYLVVPFVGASLALAGTDHLIEMGHQLAAWGDDSATTLEDLFLEAWEDPETQEESLAEFFEPAEPGPDTGEAQSPAEPPGAPRFKLWTAERTLLLGLVLLGLINVEACRRVVWRGIKAVYRVLRAVLAELPLRFFRLPWVQSVLKSRPFVLAVRFLVKPAALTALLWPLVAGWARTGQGTAALATIVFFGINLVWNSRAGRNVEEMLVDWTVQSWHRFGWRLLVNLFSLVMDLFKELLETIERLLYTVDEWLRFKSGESRTMFWAKAVLGLVWFFVTYVIRFCINLLIEPQINPIKHFPVVTVSHKVLLPLAFPFQDFLVDTTDMDGELAGTVAFLIIASIPGIFGFLVWDLKENWRLYAANRPDRLRPVRIGSHGETMPRLLRRGLHSGTLPKRFAKLRRAERKARTGGNWKAVRKHLLVLHHVERDVRRYVERELVELLWGSDGWRQVPLCVDEVRLGPGLIRVSLASPGIGTAPLSIAFEVRGGWLLAGVVGPGWTARLDAAAQDVLARAVLGLYKTAGVDLVHQQIEAALPAQSPYALVERGLIVSPAHAPGTEILYDLAQENGAVRPHVLRGNPQPAPAALERSRLLLRELPVWWRDWVAAWQRPAATSPGDKTSHVSGLSLAPFPVLPGPSFQEGSSGGRSFQQ